MCLCLLLLFFAHQHKAAGRKSRLDIQNYGCNGNLLCDHGIIIIINPEIPSNMPDSLERLSFISDVAVKQNSFTTK